MTAYKREGAFYLWLLGVRPGARHAKLATLLVKDFVAEGARRGFKKLTVKTHSGTPGMIHVLTVAGFKRTAFSGIITMVSNGDTAVRERYVYELVLGDG